MQYEPVLTTLAEMAVAMAGFSGVVVVLGGRRNPATRRVDAARTQAMVLGALLASGFSVLPILLSESGLEPPQAIWRVSCAVFGIVYAATGVVAAVRFSRIRGYRPDMSDKIMRLAAPIVLVLLSLGAVGVFGALVAGVYMVSLLFYVSVAVSMFLRVLSSHFSTDDNEDAV